MKLKTRELVLLAIFGALWGGVEIWLGSLLHALHVPMLGSVLAALGVVVALLGRLYVPRPGTTLFIGVIAMLLKLFSLGGVIIGPMVGILVEALLAEIVLSLFRRPSALSFGLAGAAAVLWTFIQPFVTGFLFYGRSLLEVWEGTLQEGSRLLGMDMVTAVFWIIGLMVTIRLVIGGAAGWFAWQSGKRLLRRAQLLHQFSEN